MTPEEAKNSPPDTAPVSSSNAVPGAERIMVCVSGSPFSEKLIRTTGRLAERLGAPWVTVYIETTGAGKHLQENRERVWNALRLAETLGAQVATLHAASVADAIVDYATRHDVTKLVIGKPKKPRWREFLRPPLVDRIIYLSGAMDVYVVSIEPAETRRFITLSTKKQPWTGYAASAALVTASTLLGRLVHRHMDPTNLVMIYLLAVVFAAVRLGLRPAILTAFLSVIAFDFFIVPPHLTLAVSDTQYLITFLALFTVGVVISSLVAQANDRAEAVRQREAQTSTLYHLSRELAVAADVDSIVDAVVRNIRQSLKAEVAVFLRDGDRLKLAGGSSQTLSGRDRATAEWVYSHREAAGRGTANFAEADYLYLLLQSGDRVFGVLGIQADVEGDTLQHMRQLVDAFANQAAMALERAELSLQAEQAQVLQARENLERALLNSVSHDLRTPLVSITGALSTLRTQGNSLHDGGLRELVDDAWEEAGRLNRFVGNLLDMTRVEAGELKLKKEPSDIQDLVGCALAPLDQRLQDRELRIDLPADLPLVPIDMVFMTQVLVNLLENAMKYSPPRTPLEISARVENGYVTIAVADYGAGVPETDLGNIFEKFHRITVPERVGGTGLGLSICKALVEAHGGTIRAENRAGGGLRVLVDVPLGEKGSRNDERE